MRIRAVLRRFFLWSNSQALSKREEDLPILHLRETQALENVPKKTCVVIDLRNLGLLKHDFRNPNTIRIRSVPPRKQTSVLLIPGRIAERIYSKRCCILRENIIKDCLQKRCREFYSMNSGNNILLFWNMVQQEAFFFFSLLNLMRTFVFQNFFSCLEFLCFLLDVAFSVATKAIPIME